jgi:dTDP-4-amino-4,6-dideoxygalactose transaminase
MTKPISLNDFRAQWSRHRDEVLAAVERVGASGWLILGDEVRSFEEALAAAWGLPFCVGCASGLDAIEIGLRCAGLQPGDKVLTTPLSAFATSLAIVRAGGVPVFVDVDEAGQIDLALCEEVLAARDDIDFMVPVHLYGHALDLDRLAAMRDGFSLRIVEDCAQAIGATSRNRPVGSVGDFAATSFYPTKNLGAMGDGGALLTQSEAHAETARALRDYGQAGKYEHTVLGLNSRLDELQAAILGSAFLPALAASTARRRETAARYRSGITNAQLTAPATPDGSQSAWHLYPLLVSGSRESFRSHLHEAGVASGVHYPTLVPEQKALAGYDPAEMTLTPLTQARIFAQREVSLPMHPFLSDEDVQRVVDACNSWTG